MTQQIVQLVDKNGNDIFPVSAGNGQVKIGETLSQPTSVEYVDTDNIIDGAVTTTKINDGAVTANKIDFTTFPHIIKAGTQTFPAVEGGEVQDVSISIPTQIDTNYVVVATHSATVNSWTWLAIQSLNKTTTSFTLRVANNSNNTTGTPSVDYIVVMP